MENSFMPSSVEPAIQSSGNRIWFLQMLRGVAAMAVLLFHIFFCFGFLTILYKPFALPLWCSLHTLHWLWRKNCLK